jgi:hypothetical protein
MPDILGGANGWEPRKSTGNPPDRVCQDDKNENRQPDRVADFD